MSNPASPSLYQVNTRVFLGELSRRLGRPATLNDIPDNQLDHLADLGFDWVWFLGVWQTGPVGRKISLGNPTWNHEFRELLSDFDEKDVCGSCFAIKDYSVHKDFGGNNQLAALRERIHERGMRLMLDFVPNHTAMDHPWVRQHPEYYVHGSQEQLAREPQNYVRADTDDGPTIFAYGRDPYFPGWCDTAQLNYAEPALHSAMASQLDEVAGMCDGLRCDMAMLILPEVFQRTWGSKMEPFWPMATRRVHLKTPDFTFMAEVYWDLEWTLQQQGFSYTYDKRLYDRLLLGQAQPVRDHFRADMNYQARSARFLENHDEPRAAAVFRPEVHRAAAVLTFLCPGLRFIHQGQLEGYRKRIPVHVSRGPVEITDVELCNFYERLLPCIHRVETREGKWQLLECVPGWDGNWTWDCFVSFAWRLDDLLKLLVVVNYSPNQSQCYLHLPFNELHGKTVVLKDLMGPERYERNGSDLFGRGLYIDLPAWGYNVFEVSSRA